MYMTIRRIVVAIARRTHVRSWCFVSLRRWSNHETHVPARCRTQPEAGTVPIAPRPHADAGHRISADLASLCVSSVGDRAPRALYAGDPPGAVAPQPGHPRAHRRIYVAAQR